METWSLRGFIGIRNELLAQSNLRHQRPAGRTLREMYDDPFLSQQGKFVRQKSSDVFAGNVSIVFRTGAFCRHVISSHNFDTHILPVLAAEIYGRISWWLPQSRCKAAALEGLAYRCFFMPHSLYHRQAQTD